LADLPGGWKPQQPLQNLPCRRNAAQQIGDPSPENDFAGVMAVSFAGVESLQNS
jgi:hypothetical protein